VPLDVPLDAFLIFFLIPSLSGYETDGNNCKARLVEILKQHGTHDWAKLDLKSLRAVARNHGLQRMPVLPKTFLAKWLKENQAFRLVKVRSDIKRTTYVYQYTTHDCTMTHKTVFFKNISHVGKGVRGK